MPLKIILTLPSYITRAISEDNIGFKAQKQDRDSVALIPYIKEASNKGDNNAQLISTYYRGNLRAAIDLIEQE